MYNRITQGEGKPKEELFHAFFKAKQKKMNFEMMLLADCVAHFNDEVVMAPEQRKQLVSYVKSIGEIAEVRAIAYHDVAVLTKPNDGG